MAFVGLAQATEGRSNLILAAQPISNTSADTLVYYMERKDAVKIAKQLITKSPNQTTQTPVHIPEAVSTARERYGQAF